MATTMERPEIPPINPKRGGTAPWPVTFYRSAVGKKWVMAVTGIMVMGFVFFHAIGNLKVYLGAEALNHYAEFLQQLLVPILPPTIALWIMRGGLLVAIGFHIHSAYGLTRMNHRANGSGYEQRRHYQAANAASRSMRWTGIVVALFILFHLADLTFGVVNPGFVTGDVYRNLVASLSRPPVAVIYIVANIGLGIHLFHGSWSMFQSLGLNNPRWNSWRRGFAIGFAGLVMVINVSFPIAVLTGVVSANNNPDCVTEGSVIVDCTQYENQEATP